MRCQTELQAGSAHLRINMNCWICGGQGNTGEHKAKASDLRAIFGSGITQQDPLFLHTDQRKNLKIGSIKSDKLKSKAYICLRCNSARTANSDKAWECLSEFLRHKCSPLKNGDLIRLDRAFPGTVKRSMLEVHLFFVKLFGCDIVEYDVPIDIAPFADAIMQQKPHPKLFLAFGPVPDSKAEKSVSRTQIETVLLSGSGQCVYATQFYVVGPILVNIIYAEPTERRNGLRNAWHPTTISKRLRIGAY